MTLFPNDSPTAMHTMSRMALFLVVAAATLGGGLVHAQTSLLDAPGRSAAEAAVALEPGFAGHYAADRWSPFTVVVSGGRRAFNGVVILDFQQDPTQKARIVAPFASTPGRDVPVPLVATLPRHLDGLTVTVRDDRGRERAKTEYSASVRGGRTLLRDPIAQGQGLIVACGRASLANVPAVWRAAQIPVDHDPEAEVGSVLADRAEAQRLGSLVVADVAPASLPRAWVAYDGAVALVVEASVSSKVDPRSLEAVRTWVAAGGALFLVADGPGPEWRAWLPPGPSGDLLELRDVAEAALPPEIATSLAEGGLDAATAAPGRAMRLTDEARRRAWRLQWTSAVDGSSGYLATGPVGHGLVVVLTFDPARASRVVSTAAAARLWRIAAAPVLEPWMKQSADESPAFARGWLVTDPRQGAINSAIDQVAGAPSFGLGVFLLLGVSAMGLALMLGPGDALILQRLRLRHRSWLTALVWIGLSSAVAYALPLVWRTGPSRLGRFRMIDTVAAADGTLISAWQTACTGLFASRAGRFFLTGVPDDSWWRGVSPLSWMPRPEGRALGEPLVSVQHPGLVSGSPLPDLHASIWTFRTLLDESAVKRAPRARIERDGESWRVSVTGLPAGAVVQSAAIRTRDGWAALPLKAVAGGFESFVSEFGDEAPPLWRRRDPESIGMAGGMRASRGQSGTRAVDGLALPGADRRSIAVDWMLDSGRWGAVYVHVTGLEPDVTVAGEAEHTGIGVLRLLAPLQGSGGDRPRGGRDD